jgi:hypothetical protein
MSQRFCKLCQVDISKTKSLKFCATCAPTVRNASKANRSRIKDGEPIRTVAVVDHTASKERAKERRKANAALRKALDLPGKLDAGKAVAFRPVSIKPDAPKQDADRLQASRSKGGHSRGAEMKQANGIAQRERTQAEIKAQTVYEYELRRKAHALPEQLRASGLTVRVRMSSEGLKHLDKESRRTYERGTKAGFQVLPEVKRHSLVLADRLVNYIGFVVR